MDLLQGSASQEDRALEQLNDASVTAQVHAALSATLDCKFAGLSGAGPTCYGIFATPEAAAAACEALRGANPRWWIVATTLGG